jgi:hypothetical protein
VKLSDVVRKKLAKKTKKTRNYDLCNADPLKAAAQAGLQSLQATGR